MADYPRRQSIDQVLRSHGEQIRRIRTRSIAARLDDITDGEALLCGGWNAPFAVISEPPEHVGSNFGFYRDSDRVYWRGALSYEGLTTNDPDRNHPANDAVNLFIPDRDAANGSTPGSGFALPQDFWPDRTLVMAVPADNENSLGYVVGRWAQMLIGWDGLVNFQGTVAFGAMAGSSATFGTLNNPHDSLDREHLGVPNGTVLHFEAVNYRPRFPG